MKTRRRYYKADMPGMEHLQGVRATADGGTCDRCDGPVLKDQRIVRQGDGWIHAACHSGQDDQ